MGVRRYPATPEGLVTVELSDGGTTVNSEELLKSSLLLYSAAITAHTRSKREEGEVHAPTGSFWQTYPPVRTHFLQDHDVPSKRDFQGMAPHFRCSGSTENNVLP